MQPQRIVLSRRSGFNLQAISRGFDGLPAQSVARPGPWGNPFSIDAVAAELGVNRAEAQAQAVARHKSWITGTLKTELAPPSPEKIKAELGGKNLACWCPQGTPCHVEILLQLAND